MGIFLVFAVTSFAGLTLARQSATGGAMSAALEQSGLAASAMPLVFAVFLSAVPEYGARAGLLFGFLLIIVLGIAAVAIARRDGALHAMGGLATLLVFGVWLATSYATTSWQTVAAFAVAFAAVFAATPFVADRLRRPLPDVGSHASYVAPILLFTIAVIVRIEPQTEAPWTIFAAAFVILAIVVWRAFTAGDAGLYFAAAFFALAAEASWSATHFSPARLWTAVALYAAFALFYLGVPLAWRRLGRVMEPKWGSGAVLLASLAMLLFLAAGPRASGALWGLALLLAILDAGLFIESAAGRTPVLSMAGGLLSWVVLAVWWSNAGTAVGVLPSLLVIVGLTMIMFAGHAWAARQAGRRRQRKAGRPASARASISVWSVTCSCFTSPRTFAGPAAVAAARCPPGHDTGGHRGIAQRRDAASARGRHRCGRDGRAGACDERACRLGPHGACGDGGGGRVRRWFAVCRTVRALELRCARHRRDHHSICRRARCHCRGARRC